MSLPAENNASELLEVIPLIMRSIHTYMRDRVASHLSVAQFRALNFLRRHEGASLSDFAEYMGLMLPSASKVIDGLVVRKWVTRHTDAADRRRIAISITARGRAKLSLVHREAEKHLTQKLANLSRPDHLRLAETLGSLRSVFTPAARTARPAASPAKTRRRAVLPTTAAALLCLAGLGHATASDRELSGVTAEKQTHTITLEQAYDITLATDQSIQIAAYEIKRANLLPWSAVAQLGPRLNASANGTRQHTARTTYNVLTTTTLPDGTVSSERASVRMINTSDTRSATVALQQPLLDLTVFPNYKLGKLTSRSAKLQYRFNIRTVLFGVAKAYYEVLKEQSLVTVNQETLDLANQQLDLAQKRHEVGEVARIDVLRAQSSVATSQRTLIESQNILELDRNTLSNILNFGGRTDFAVVEPAGAPTDVGSFNSNLAVSYAQREDLQVSRIAIEQSIQARNTIIAQYGPSVSAFLSDNWSAERNNTSGSTWNAQIGVSIPIFDGGQREINLGDALYVINEKRLEFEETSKSVEADVKTAWLAVQTLRETIKASRADVAANEQNYSDVENQYKAGAATSLDTLSALRDLNNSRTILTTEIFDYQVALRDLDRAVGRFQQQRVQQVAPK